MIAQLYVLQSGDKVINLLVQADKLQSKTGCVDKMSSDQSNWPYYYEGFCKAFKFLNEKLVDPHVFKKGEFRLQYTSLD